MLRLRTVKPWSGKRGGGSFEIEIALAIASAQGDPRCGKRCGGSFEIEIWRLAGMHRFVAYVAREVVAHLRLK